MEEKPSDEETIQVSNDNLFQFIPESDEFGEELENDTSNGRNQESKILKNAAEKLEVLNLEKILSVQIDQFQSSDDGNEDDDDSWSVGGFASDRDSLDNFDPEKLRESGSQRGEVFDNLWPEKEVDTPDDSLETSAKHSLMYSRELLILGNGLKVEEVEGTFENLDMDRNPEQQSPNNHFVNLFDNQSVMKTDPEFFKGQTITNLIEMESIGVRINRDQLPSVDEKEAFTKDDVSDLVGELIDIACESVQFDRPQSGEDETFVKVAESWIDSDSHFQSENLEGISDLFLLPEDELEREGEEISMSPEGEIEEKCPSTECSDVNSDCDQQDEAEDHKLHVEGAREGHRQTLESETYHFSQDIVNLVEDFISTPESYEEDLSDLFLLPENNFGMENQPTIIFQEGKTFEEDNSLEEFTKISRTMKWKHIGDDNPENNSEELTMEVKEQLQFKSATENPEAVFFHDALDISRENMLLMECKNRDDDNPENNSHWEPKDFDETIGIPKRLQKDENHEIWYSKGTTPDLYEDDISDLFLLSDSKLTKLFQENLIPSESSPVEETVEEFNNLKESNIEKTLIENHDELDSTFLEESRVHLAQEIEAAILKLTETSEQREEVEFVGTINVEESKSTPNPMERDHQLEELKFTLEAEGAKGGPSAIQPHIYNQNQETLRPEEDFSQRNLSDLLIHQESKVVGEAQEHSDDESNSLKENATTQSANKCQPGADHKHEYGSQLEITEDPEGFKERLTATGEDHQESDIFQERDAFESLKGNVMIHPHVNSDYYNSLDEIEEFKECSPPALEAEIEKEQQQIEYLRKEVWPSSPESYEEDISDLFLEPDDKPIENRRKTYPSDSEFFSEEMSLGSPSTECEDVKTFHDVNDPIFKHELNYLGSVMAYEDLIQELDDHLNTEANQGCFGEFRDTPSDVENSQNTKILSLENQGEDKLEEDDQMSLESYSYQDDFEVESEEELILKNVIQSESQGLLNLKDELIAQGLYEPLRYLEEREETPESRASPVLTDVYEVEEIKDDSEDGSEKKSSEEDKRSQKDHFQVGNSEQKEEKTNAIEEDYPEKEDEIINLGRVEESKISHDQFPSEDWFTRKIENDFDQEIHEEGDPSFQNGGEESLPDLSWLLSSPGDELCETIHDFEIKVNFETEMNATFSKDEKEAELQRSKSTIEEDDFKGDEDEKVKLENFLTRSWFDERIPIEENLEEANANLIDENLTLNENKESSQSSLANPVCEQDKERFDVSGEECEVESSSRGVEDEGEQPSCQSNTDEKDCLDRETNQHFILESKFDALTIEEMPDFVEKSPAKEMLNSEEILSSNGPEDYKVDSTGSDEEDEPIATNKQSGGHNPEMVHTYRTPTRENLGHFKCQEFLETVTEQDEEEGSGLPDLLKTSKNELLDPLKNLFDKTSPGLTIQFIKQKEVDENDTYVCSTTDNEPSMKKAIIHDIQIEEFDDNEAPVTIVKETEPMLRLESGKQFTQKEDQESVLSYFFQSASETFSSQTSISARDEKEMKTEYPTNQFINQEEESGNEVFHYSKTEPETHLTINDEVSMPFSNTGTSEKPNQHEEEVENNNLGSQNFDVKLCGETEPIFNEKENEQNLTAENSCAQPPEQEKEADNIDFEIHENLSIDSEENEKLTEFLLMSKSDGQSIHQGEDFSPTVSGCNPDENLTRVTLRSESGDQFIEYKEENKKENVDNPFRANETIANITVESIPNEANFFPKSESGDQNFQHEEVNKNNGYDFSNETTENFLNLEDKETPVPNMEFGHQHIQQEDDFDHSIETTEFFLQKILEFNTDEEKTWPITKTESGESDCVAVATENPNNITVGSGIESNLLTKAQSRDEEVDENEGFSYSDTITENFFIQNVEPDLEIIHLTKSGSRDKHETLDKEYDFDSTTGSFYNKALEPDVETNLLTKSESRDQYIQSEEAEQEEDSDYFDTTTAEQDMLKKSESADLNIKHEEENKNDGFDCTKEVIENFSNKSVESNKDPEETWALPKSESEGESFDYTNKITTENFHHETVEPATEANLLPRPHYYDQFIQPEEVENDLNATTESFYNKALEPDVETNSLTKSESRDQYIQNKEVEQEEDSDYFDSTTGNFLNKTGEQDLLCKSESGDPDNQHIEENISKHFDYSIKIHENFPNERLESNTNSEEAWSLPLTKLESEPENCDSSDVTTENFYHRTDEPETETNLLPRPEYYDQFIQPEKVESDFDATTESFYNKAIEPDVETNSLTKTVSGDQYMWHEEVDQDEVSDYFDTTTAVQDMLKNSEFGFDCTKEIIENFSNKSVESNRDPEETWPLPKSESEGESFNYTNKITTEIFHHRTVEPATEANLKAKSESRDQFVQPVEDIENIETKHFGCLNKPIDSDTQVSELLPSSESSNEFIRQEEVVNIEFGNNTPVSDTFLLETTESGNNMGTIEIQSNAGEDAEDYPIDNHVNPEPLSNLLSKCHPTAQMNLIPESLFQKATECDQTLLVTPELESNLEVSILDQKSFEAEKLGDSKQDIKDPKEENGIVNASFMRAEVKHFSNSHLETIPELDDIILVENHHETQEPSPPCSLNSPTEDKGSNHDLECFDRPLTHQLEFPKQRNFQNDDTIGSSLSSLHSENDNSFSLSSMRSFEISINQKTDQLNPTSRIENRPKLGLDNAIKSRSFYEEMLNGTPDVGLLVNTLNVVEQVSNESDHFKREFPNEKALERSLDHVKLELQPSQDFGNQIQPQSCSNEKFSNGFEELSESKLEAEEQEVSKKGSSEITHSSSDHSADEHQTVTDQKDEMQSHMCNNEMVHEKFAKAGGGLMESKLEIEENDHNEPDFVSETILDGSPELNPNNGGKIEVEDIMEEEKDQNKPHPVLEIYSSQTNLSNLAAVMEQQAPSNIPSQSCFDETGEAELSTSLVEPLANNLGSEEIIEHGRDHFSIGNTSERSPEINRNLTEHSNRAVLLTPESQIETSDRLKTSNESQICPQSSDSGQPKERLDFDSPTIESDMMKVRASKDSLPIPVQNSTEKSGSVTSGVKPPFAYWRNLTTATGSTPLPTFTKKDPLSSPVFRSIKDKLPNTANEKNETKVNIQDHPLNHHEEATKIQGQSVSTEESPSKDVKIFEKQDEPKQLQTIVPLSVHDLLKDHQDVVTTQVKRTGKPPFMDLQLHFSSLEVTDSKNFVSDSDLLKLIPDSDSPTIPTKDLKADLLLDDPECDKGIFEDVDIKPAEVVKLESVSTNPVATPEQNSGLFERFCSCLPCFK